MTETQAATSKLRFGVSACLLGEEVRLNGLPLRENFIERVFIHYRWQQMLTNDPAPGALVKFHTGIKMSLLSHSPEHYRELGQLVAQSSRKDIALQYGKLLMDGLKVMSTPGKHVSVLMHLMGFIR